MCLQLWSVGAARASGRKKPEGDSSGEATYKSHFPGEVWLRGTANRDEEILSGFLGLQPQQTRKIMSS